MWSEENGPAIYSGLVEPENHLADSGLALAILSYPSLQEENFHMMLP